MRILIIDSHKGSLKEPENLHWLNAKQVQTRLSEMGHDVDLIWSYPTVNDDIRSGYDKIVFNHASHYAYIDIKWLEANPSAELYYITNEYNLGEPMLLWKYVKQEGRKYTVIANHDVKASKVVEKYTSEWHITNLNALVTNETISRGEGTGGAVYYGSFRKDRVKYYSKYLIDGCGITLSTHSKNAPKFADAGATCPIVKRLNWNKGDLGMYDISLYIEDEKTHTYYNHLANRFYESLNHGVLPVFDENCRGTIEQSDYEIPDSLIVAGPDELRRFFNDGAEKTRVRDGLIEAWHAQALDEKSTVLSKICSIILA